MLDYAVRRILLLIPTLIIGSALLFTALKVLPPQDAIELKLGPEIVHDDPGIVDAQRRALGIYGSLPSQYFRWLGGFVTGQWGKSLVSKRPIFGELKNRIPVSFEISFIGLFFTWTISFPLGVFAAVCQDKWPDYFLRTGAYALDALPSFVMAILLLTYLAVYFNWAPPVTFSYIWDNPIRHIKIMLLPTFIIGVTSSGNLIRFTRTFLLETLRQDYIRTARSKGLPEHTVLLRHALRNIALPFITIIGAEIPRLLSSSAIIEQLFNLPGMGRYLVTAASALDYPVVMTTTMFYGTIILLTQLVTDLSYAWADPRVSYSRRRG
jgi:ABC-type dipeptide/oligopeptide/nickel transport system permease component